MFDRDKFYLVQSTGSQGGIGVFDEAGDSLAIIAGPPTSSVLGCLMLCATIVAGVVTFFAVPIPAIWLFCRATGFSFDDPQQSIVWQVIVVIGGFVVALVVMGMVLAALSSLFTPRVRLGVYSDPPRGQRLLEIVEDRKSKYNVSKFTVYDPDGGVVGRIHQNKRRRQWDLLDREDRRVAAYCPRENTVPVEWTADAVWTVLAGIVVGVLTSYYYFVTPGKEKVRTKSYLWSLDEQTGKPIQRIGKTEFDPDEEFTYAIFVAADPERKIDRRLIVALASLLEW